MAGQRRRAMRRVAALGTGRKNRMHKFLSTFVVGAAAATLVVGTAIAAPGDGAQRVKQHSCFTEPGLYTFCSDVDLVLQTTQTPSGNTMVMVNGSIGETFTGEGGDFAGCSTSFSSEIHSQYLNMQGDDGVEFTHELHLIDRGESSYHCGGALQDCVINIHNHYANGEWQFFRPEITCT
jgi:hypothetical protein